MEIFQGAVFFIDMLGMSALTNGKVNLEKEDFDAWSISNTEFSAGIHEMENEHYLSGRFLQCFRNVLSNASKIKSHKNILYAQLSDGAFIWSEDIGKLLEVATYVMWNVSNKGLLCRAGLSYGNFMRIKKEGTLGQFIVGSAVTNAVNNEDSGKGARIFCDKRTHDKIRDIPARVKPSLIELKNPLDGTSVYEFQWYHHPISNQKVSDKTKAEQLIDLYTTFTLSAKLAWSARSEEGRMHLRCSINAFAQALNNLLGEEDFVPIWSLDKIKNTKRWQTSRNIKGEKNLLAKEIETLKTRAKEILQKKQQI